jgi:hypothetical protein
MVAMRWGFFPLWSWFRVLAFLPIRSKNGAAPLLDLVVGFRWSRGSHGGWRDGGEQRGKEYGLAIFTKSKGFWMMCMYVHIW